MKIIYEKNVEKGDNYKMNSSLPLITLGVPFYNSEAYLMDCLASIKAQTYQNLEILLLNDGSTDSSLELAQSYAQTDDRVRIISQENEGLGFARMHLIDAAQGEFVSFVDSDDVLAANYIDYLYQLIEKSQADMAAISELHFEGDLPRAVQQAPEKSRVFAGDEIIRYSLNFKADQLIKKVLPDFPSTWVVSWGKLYRRDVLLQSNVDGNHFNDVGEDNTLFLSLLKNYKKIIISNQRLYYYRDRADSLNSSNFNKKHIPNLFQENYFVPFQDFISWCKANRPQLLPYANLLQALSMYMVYIEFLQSGEELTETMKKYIRYLKGFVFRHAWSFFRIPEVSFRPVFSFVKFVLLPLPLAKKRIKID